MNIISSLYHNFSSFPPKLSIIKAGLLIVSSDTFQKLMEVILTNFLGHSGSGIFFYHILLIF